MEVNGEPCVMITGMTVTPGKNIAIAGEDRGREGGVFVIFLWIITKDFIVEACNIYFTILCHLFTNL